MSKKLTWSNENWCGYCRLCGFAYSAGSKEEFYKQVDKHKKKQHKENK